MARTKPTSRPPKLPPGAILTIDRSISVNKIISVVRKVHRDLRKGPVVLTDVRSGDGWHIRHKYIQRLLEIQLQPGAFGRNIPFLLKRYESPPTIYCPYIPRGITDSMILDVIPGVFNIKRSGKNKGAHVMCRDRISAAILIRDGFAFGKAALEFTAAFRRQCKQCLSFEHSRCDSPKLCRLCGSHEHRTSDCDAEEQLCFLCDGDHMAHHCDTIRSTKLQFQEQDTLEFLSLIPTIDQCHGGHVDPEPVLSIRQQHLLSDKEIHGQKDYKSFADALKASSKPRRRQHTVRQQKIRQKQKKEVVTQKQQSEIIQKEVQKALRELLPSIVKECIQAIRAEMKSKAASHILLRKVDNTRNL